MGNRQWFVLYVLVCLEVGIFLVLVPWSAIWERNYFLEAYPHLRPVLMAPMLRGAVCGLGLANIYLGVNEVFHRWRTSIARENDTDFLSAADRDHETSHRPRRSETSKALAAPEEP